MKTFRCVCGNVIHFENVQCLECQRALGFLPGLRELSAIEPGEQEGVWRALAPAANGVLYRKCNNYQNHNVCNWMVDLSDPEPFCTSCRLNHVIPNLSKPGNEVLWYRVERAKRRLVYDLMRLDLPVVSKSVDEDRGLAFEFLEDTNDEAEFSDPGGGVVTGHADGLITINLAEAVASEREKMREQLNERYRTLLGHFRHEVGHYYWDRLVRDGEWIDEFRRLFGDDREDYNERLQRYYQNGPPEDWQSSHISAYATAHPWEDWAETWAHYLHIHSTLETAKDFELSVRKTDFRLSDRPPGEGPVPAYLPVDPVFFDLLADWHSLAMALNALNRSMGLRDAYPFALSDAAIEKLYLVHRVMRKAAAAPLQSAAGLAS